MKYMNSRRMWCSCALLAMSMQAMAQLRSLHVEMVYPRIEMGREIVVCMAYTNLLPGARRLYPFRFGKSLGGFYGEIVCGTNVVRLVDRVENSFPSDESTFADTNGLMVCDLILPKDSTPSTPGLYELRLEKVAPVERLVSGSGIVNMSNVAFKLPPLPFEVVSPDTPTPERPRPWEDYNKDPSRYPELKKHLLAMPPHRFGRAGLSGALWLDVFCDPDFSKERRLAPVESLLWRQRPYNAKLLPLALDEKTDEDLRLRAMMLLGGMDKNDAARTELIKRYWRKDDAGKPSALYRMAFLHGGDGALTVPYGRIDPSPQIRAMALVNASVRGYYEEVVAIAKTLTNCTEEVDARIFPEVARLVHDRTVGMFATRMIPYSEKVLVATPNADTPKVFPLPPDLAAQAEAVRKLFH